MSHARRASRGYSLVVLFTVIFIGWGLFTAFAASGIEVNSADPPEMEQSQTIDVIIKGNGFDTSAAAKFLVSGTKKTGGVTVNSTTFIDAQTLRANVTAAPDATIGKFDIAVRQSKGRRGKGIELFSVKENPKKGGAASPVNVTFRDGLGDKIMSDNGRPYMNKVDKVSAQIGNNFFMSLARPNQVVIRTLFLDFTDCASDSDPLSLDFEPCSPPPVFSMGFGPTLYASVYATTGGTLGGTAGAKVQLNEMAIGESNDLLRLRVDFNPDSRGRGTWSLWFDPLRIVSGGGDNPLLCPESTLVDVTRTAADTWVISAGEGDVACLRQRNEDTDELDPRGRYRAPFQITVKTQ